MRLRAHLSKSHGGLRHVVHAHKNNKGDRAINNTRMYKSGQQNIIGMEVKVLVSEHCWKWTSKIEACWKHQSNKNRLVIRRTMNSMRSVQCKMKDCDCNLINDD